MVVMEEGESLQRAQRHVAAEVLWVVGVAGDEEREVKDAIMLLVWRLLV